jgi:hypothetical protein
LLALIRSILELIQPIQRQLVELFHPIPGRLINLIEPILSGLVMLFLFSLQRGKYAGDVVHIGLQPHDAGYGPIFSTATLLVKRGLVHLVRSHPVYQPLSGGGYGQL